MDPIDNGNELCYIGGPMNSPLTIQEENVLKDILKAIGNDSELNAQFAANCGLFEVTFDSVTDSIYKKLGNGRVTEVDAPEFDAD